MKIGTHDGRFHADEVFAIALLLRIYLNADIVRTRDPEVLATCDIVVDVGSEYNQERGRFDHHQTGGAGEWPNSTPFSSFGLVWHAYRSYLGLPSEVESTVERYLVIPIDARDNGRQPERRPLDIASLADYINSLNPAWDEEGFKENAAFMKAVTFAGDYLERLIVQTKAQHLAKSEVRTAINTAADPRLIILEQHMPWEEVVISEAPQALFVVQPGQAGAAEWLLQAVRQEGAIQGAYRRRLPKAWNGLAKEGLVAVTGVPDAKFSHNMGFIAIAYSKEGVLALARQALDT